MRAAARNIARTYGSLRKLATALGVDTKTLTRRARPSAGLAIALARIANVSVDSVLGRSGLSAVPDYDRGDPAGNAGGTWIPRLTATTGTATGPSAFATTARPSMSARASAPRASLRASSSSASRARILLPAARND
jgi:hypothetical protein